MNKPILIALGVLVAALGALLFFRGKRSMALRSGEKKPKRIKKLGVFFIIVGLWLTLSASLPLIFGTVESKPFHVDIMPQRVEVAGLSLSSTVITTWVAMGIIVLVALILRLTLIPRMKRIPTGLQNVLELMVDGVRGYTQQKASGLGENLSAYLFSVAVLLVACAVVELFGVRAPTADITMTFALALCTFFMINYYGIKRKGVGGRIKSLANPTPLVFPLRVISDIALPVSMACRLFGNMLGGMIVMELIYTALGSGAVGLPSVVGLYFNVFHPLIQAFIFITLTLTFIGEATELEGEG